MRDRPEFAAGLEDARSGMVDALLTYHADRLTREGVNAAALVLDVLEGKDSTTGKVTCDPVRLVAVDGLDTALGDDAFWLRFLIGAEVARAGRQRIKARNAATRKRLVKAGRWTGGSVPFGCRAVPNPEGPGLVLEADPDEAELLTVVAGKLIEGESIRACVRWLSQRSLTRRGKEWARTSLRVTLTSEATRRYVLDAATRRALDKRLNGLAPADKPKGGRPRRWLLAGGMALCESCGRKLTTSAGRYLCSSTGEGRSCPAIVSIGAEAVDAWLAERFLARYGHRKASRHPGRFKVLDGWNVSLDSK